MEDLLQRIRTVIDESWTAFTLKVGNGELNINKEASMQLQYAVILMRNYDSITLEKDESINVELETSIQVGDHLRECDIVVIVTKGEVEKRIPIELKCYKTFNATGKRRYAHDIFKFGVYEDLMLLEAYASNENYENGIQLTMTDNPSFSFPKKKDGKGWDYDTSDGFQITNGIEINTPIGGNNTASIRLEKSYNFNWTQVNEFYFINLQGE